MKWFDGTFDEERKEFVEKYPVEVCEDLRLSKDSKRMTVINNFEDGSFLSDLADPEANKSVFLNKVFYHVFKDDKDGKIKKAINDFVSNGYDQEEASIELARNDPERLYVYSYGYICKSLLDKQDELKEELLDNQEEYADAFVLPLRRYMYKCPICFKRTLMYRGYYEICEECGWEDEGYDEDDPDEEDGVGLGANGTISMKDLENSINVQSKIPLNAEILR